ncbi:hypothetical protein [Paenibacillus pinistramenti]|uniref:hypothetical protein n=1 Tax=Paenibacillus pinistramenti TaxID=1768003 RepID=UPI0011085B0D|nr:hypothetical protein [Paenibacillus pinistramenti]
MIKPWFNAAMTAVLLAGLLSACKDGQDEEPAALPASAAAELSAVGSAAEDSAAAEASTHDSADPAAGSDSPSETPDPAALNFKEGIVADVQALDNPLIHSDIKELLDQMMKAMVEGDEQAFYSLFPNSESAAYFSFEFEGSPKYRFEEIDEGAIQKDSEGRVLLPVSGRVQRDGQVHEFSWAVYFKKDKEGVWHLIALD